MGWFRRRTDPAPSLTFATREALEAFVARLTAAGIDPTSRSLRKDGLEYHIWRGSDTEKAKRWLSDQSIPELTYYVVETPDGEWGADVRGLFRETLQNWQFDAGDADCEGTIVGLPDKAPVVYAARGETNNFLVVVSCGRCASTWFEGVRYQNVTAVRCPSCRSLNKVDSSNITVG